MNKKLIFTISVLTIVATIVIVSILYFVNQSNTKRAVIADTTNNSKNIVDKKLEEISKVVRPAVENYLTQDITESSSARNTRLSAYFIPNSPVFGREIEIRSTNSATKTTAKVTAVNYSAGQGEYPFLITKTDITSYSGVNKYTSSQTYWISLRQNADKSYVAYDVGIME